LTLQAACCGGCSELSPAGLIEQGQAQQNVDGDSVGGERQDDAFDLCDLCRVNELRQAARP
jgi:ferredoxin